ncbi:hypothetical protein E4T44_06278 [Aureobasidium sp. EXF-8845]|nr:hypothetical protein E4T44_06278 [Aureobasidium sp. EXF-8845]KAI4845123.1 hypothetical protein E4T45_07852 [Aureobasidium sp. EXF-8846]
MNSRLLRRRPGRAELLSWLDQADQQDGPIFDRDWKAQVLEARAADEHHVFLHCSWLETPEDLPKEVLSTPSYHGRFELVPSNKMDIIDAFTVNGPLEVAYWEEASDDADMPAHDDDY